MDGCDEGRSAEHHRSMVLGNGWSRKKSVQRHRHVPWKLSCRGGREVLEKEKVVVQMKKGGGLQLWEAREQPGAAVRRGYYLSSLTLAHLCGFEQTAREQRQLRKHNPKSFYA